MKDFFLKLIAFTFITFIIFETSIRILNLTNDVPSRVIDKNGLQSFIPNQTGVYGNNYWEVNKYGFLGKEQIRNNKDKILIIGDSMIENIMNQNICHLDHLLSSNFSNNIDFFEIGRSGMTLIESLEFNRKFKKLFNPTYSIIFVNENDVEESISNINRYNDRLQINLKTSSFESVKIKYENLKYLLYNIKSLYFLYMKGFFSAGDFFKKPFYFKNKNKLTYDTYFNTFFSFVKENYESEKIIFLINEDQKKYIDELKKIDVNLITFKSNEKWLNKNDSHWNCFGNNEISILISKYLTQLPNLKNYSDGF